MKRGVGYHILGSILILSLLIPSVYAGAEQCELCFGYFNAEGNKFDEKCAKFGETITRDLDPGINRDFRFEFTIRNCPQQINDAWKLCTRYSNENEGGRTGKGFECAPFGQTRVHTFTGVVGQDHYFDMKVECNKDKVDCNSANLPLFGSKLCVRYKDINGRLAAGWNCKPFGRTVETDFEGQVDSNDDFDIRILAEPPQKEVKIPYGSNDWSAWIKDHTQRRNSPSDDDNGKDWMSFDYDEDDDDWDDNTETPLGTHGCQFNDAISTPLSFSKVFLRHKFTLDDKTPLTFYFGIDDKVTCYLNTKEIFSKTNNICGMEKEFTELVPKENTIKGDNILACQIENIGGPAWFDLELLADHVEIPEPDKDKNLCKNAAGAVWADGTPDGPCCGDDKEQDAGVVSNSKTLKCRFTQGKGEWLPTDPDKNSEECVAAGGKWTGSTCCGNSPSDTGQIHGGQLCKDAELIPPGTDPFKIETINNVDYISNGDQWISCGSFGSIPSPSSNKARAAKFFCSYHKDGRARLRECCMPDANDERKCQNPDPYRILPGETTFTISRGFTTTFKKAGNTFEAPFMYSNWLDGNMLAVSYMVTEDPNIFLEATDSSGNILVSKNLKETVIGLPATNRFMTSYIPIPPSASSVSKLKFIFQPADTKKTYNNMLTVGRIWLSAASEFICSAAKLEEPLKSPWITDYDSPFTDATSTPVGKSACDGSKSFKWTGTKCCGDDKAETYNDGDNGCKNGVAIGEGSIVDAEGKTIFVEKKNWFCGRAPIPIVLPSPLAYWSFEEEEYDKVFDKSSNGYDGKIVNGAPHSDDVQLKSKVIEFDGNDDYIAIDKQLTLSDKNTFSVDFLIKTPDTLPDKDKSKAIMQVQGNAFGGRSEHASFAFNNQGLRMNWWADHDPTTGTGGNSWNIETDIPPDTWIHVTGTWKRDGNKVIGTLYIDGEQKDSKQSGLLTFQNFPSYTILGATSHSTAYPDTYLEGSLDDVRIWNTALTAEQIKELFNRHASAGKLPAKEADAPFCTVKGDYFCSIIEKKWNPRPSSSSIAKERDTAKAIPPGANLLKNGGFEEIR